MYRNHIKKGFTMVEALCSISILSILLLFAFSIQISSYKIKCRNDIKNKNIEILEAVKSDIYESGYEKINLLNSNVSYYIKHDSLETNIIRNEHVYSLSLMQKPDAFPYVVYNVEPCGHITKVHIKLNYKIFNKEESMECETYFMK